MDYHIKNICAHPEERVQRAVFHKLSDDHDRAALGHHSFQMDDIRVIKLPHDARLAQEVPPLLLCITRLKCFDGNEHLSFPREL